MGAGGQIPQLSVPAKCAGDANRKIKYSQLNLSLRYIEMQRAEAALHMHGPLLYIDLYFLVAAVHITPHSCTLTSTFSRVWTIKGMDN